MIMVGASAVAVGTANLMIMYGCARLMESGNMKKKNVADIGWLIGCVR